MKIGVAFYYKDIELYPEQWVNQCIDSIRSQTYQDFEVYVLNYGEKENNSFDFNIGKRTYFRHKPLPNYADAMNEIYSWIFESCDIAVNTNVDDFYDINRIGYLLGDINQGSDIATSNYHIINENGIITYSPDYSKWDIEKTLKSGYNPVSNPAHIMKKKVFEKLQFDSSLVPIEDMAYWIKAIDAGFKITINKCLLHYYRMHRAQSTNKVKNI